MKYCKDCGKPTQRLKSDWYSKQYRCIKCGLRILIIDGDKDTGLADIYYFQDHPFENEIKYEPKKRQKMF